MDPVDNTKQTPEGEDYPSGVKALKQLGKPVGISGAGIVGRCNPQGSNYQVPSPCDFIKCRGSGKTASPACDCMPAVHMLRCTELPCPEIR